MKEDLRPCSVKIGEETETLQCINSDPITRIVKEGETHKGYFHKWIDEGASSGCESVMKSYGIVEYDDGTVHKVDPECITFTDRNNDIIDYVKELHPDWK